MDENPLKGYYLTRVYKGDDPFTTVMDLFREDAVAVCEKVVPNRHVSKPGSAAYLDAREEVESWARESAKAVGVDIKEQNPIYFALTKEPETSTPDRRVVSIPAEKVDLSCCSFTYGDSFTNSPASLPQTGVAEDHPLQGVVFKAGQMKAVLEKYGVPGNYGSNGKGYIEVQMWGRPSADVVPPVKTQPPKSQPKL